MDLNDHKQNEIVKDWNNNPVLSVKAKRSNSSSEPFSESGFNRNFSVASI